MSKLLFNKIHFYNRLIIEAKAKNDIEAENNARALLYNIIEKAIKLKTKIKQN